MLVDFLENITIIQIEREIMKRVLIQIGLLLVGCMAHGQGTLCIRPASQQPSDGAQWILQHSARSNRAIVYSCTFFCWIRAILFGRSNPSAGTNVTCKFVGRLVRHWYAPWSIRPDYCFNKSCRCDNLLLFNSYLRNAWHNLLLSTCHPIRRQRTNRGRFFNISKWKRIFSGQF